MTKINPFTNRPQAYPSTQDELATLWSWQINAGQGDRAAGEREQRAALTNDHYSTAFAMIETWLENEGASIASLNSNHQRLMDDLGKVITDGTIPDISLWISELIQNALDAEWGDGVGAERVELDFEENTFTFSHDGRPPQYVDWNVNELRSMIESGSTKRADISKEGRFGIGFKYWIYYFEEVTVSSSGWKISWDNKQNIQKPEMTEDLSPGLKIKFTKPILDQPDEQFTPYTILAADPRSIISGGIVRLVEGLALQPAPMEVVVRSGQEQIFNFTHSTTPLSHIQPDLNIPIDLFEVTNSLTYAENVEHTISVPTKLIGVDVAQLYDRAIQKHHNPANDNTEEPDESEPPVLEEVFSAYSEIADALHKELRNHNTSFAGPILRGYANETGLEWDSADNKEKAAKREAKKIKSICLIDVSNKPIEHHLLNALFPISKRFLNQYDYPKGKTVDRFYFVGSYHTNEDRTSLSPLQARNSGILHAQFASMNLLMSLVAIPDFREENQLSAELHQELLLSNNWFGDVDFSSIVSNNSESIQIRKFHSFSAWPVIRRARGVISQEYVALGEVVRLRQHFENLLQSEDASVRTWAQNIVEPDECCIYATRTEGENEISEWIPCYPYLAPLSEQSFRPRLMKSDVPESTLASKIQSTIQPKRVEWPEWLPIPLAEIGGDSKNWYTPDACENFVILGGESGEDEEQEWPDNFTSSVHEESVKKGMKSYSIVDGFSLPDDKKIHGKEIEDTGKERLFQLSIEYLREKHDNFADYITKLLEKEAQNHDYWPVFCHSSSDELLMIHQPTKYWNQTFICMNDVFADHQKSIWSQKGNDFYPILDALQSEVQQGEAGQYIENLSDPAVSKYTHLIFEEEGGAWCDAFSALKRWTPAFKHDIPKFSECSYHYLDDPSKNRNKHMAFVNIQSAVWPKDTSEEFKKKRRAKLPPLPNVLRALHLPMEFKEQIPCFKPYQNRSDFLNMYEMNLQNSRGFYRHIFNLNECGRDGSEQFNSNNSQSHIGRTQIERNMFDNRDNDTVLQGFWRSALQNFDHPKSRNYAFMFHVLSPSAYAMEQLIGEHESQQKLNNALILSSFEGLYTENFKLPTGRRTFSPYFCAITRGSDKNHELVIDKAKLGPFTQAKGDLTDISTLSENMFHDYKPNYVGFNSNEDDAVKFFDVPLFGAVGQRAGTQENEYLPSLWSPRVGDGEHNEGLVARMLLEATKQQGTLPFTELGLGEMYRQDGYNRTMATDILRDSLKRVFWEHEGESLVFKWLFHPRGKAINTLINELVSQVSGDANTSILRIVEALHYRALSLYPEDTELLNARLRHWFSVYLTEWANVISPDFSTAIKEAREGAEKKTLLEGFKDCSTFQDIFVEIKKHPHHLMRHTFATSNWKRSDLRLTNQIRDPSRLIITESSSIFGKVDRNETYNTGTGFGLLANHFWCPLRGEEINYLISNIPDRVDPELDWKFVATGFTKKLQRAFESQSEALSQTSPDGSTDDEQEEVDEQFSFLQDVVDWLYLHTLSSMGQLNSVGDRVMHFRPRVQIDYQSPNTRVVFDGGGMGGVILGPAGWNISYEDGTLTFSTSHPKSKENFQNKIEMLETIFARVMDEFYRSSIRLSEIDTNRIRNEFSINHPPSTRFNPLKDFESWYEFYCSDLVEPDQDFLAYHEGGDWREKDSAERLLEALEANIHTWFEQNYATKTEWKAELVKMYGNGMTCTLHDFRQPHLADQMAGDMDRLMKVIRLHSGQGNNPTGVLDENQARLNQIGKKFKHLGNSLLVSSNAEHLGSRLNGWRLVAPPGHEGSSFLSYLDNHWQDLAYDDGVLDLERIILEEVVLQPDDDAIHDRRGSFELHKLHMLYILAFYRATLAADEEEE